MLRRGLLDLVVEPGVNEFTKETPWDRVWIVGGFLLLIVVLLIVFYIKNKRNGGE